MAEWILGLPTSLTKLHILFNTFERHAFTSFSRLTNLKELALEVVNAPRPSWSPYLDFESLPHSLITLRLILQDEERDYFTDIRSNVFKGTPPSVIHRCKLPPFPAKRKYIPERRSDARLVPSGPGCGTARQVRKSTIENLRLQCYSRPKGEYTRLNFETRVNWPIDLKGKWSLRRIMTKMKTICLAQRIQTSYHVRIYTLIILLDKKIIST